MKRQRKSIVLANPDFNVSSWKSVRDDLVQCSSVANLSNGLPCCSERLSIMIEHRRPRAQLRLSRWRIAIGSEVIVKSPRPYLFPESHNFRRFFRIATMRQHAFEVRHVLRDDLPASRNSGFDDRALSVYQRTGRTIAGTRPDCFPLYLRVQRECRGLGISRVGRWRQSKRYGIAEVITRKSKSQPLWSAAMGALYRDLTFLHAIRNTRWARPERRLQTALASQRVDYATTGRFCEQA